MFRGASLKAPKDPLLSTVSSRYYYCETSCLHDAVNGAVRTQKWNKSVCPSEGLGLDFAGLIMFIRHLKCYVIFQITSNFAFSMPS